MVAVATYCVCRSNKLDSTPIVDGLGLERVSECDTACLGVCDKMQARMRDACCCWSVGLFVVALAGELLDWRGDQPPTVGVSKWVVGRCVANAVSLWSGKVAGGSRKDESG